VGKALQMVIVTALVMVAGAVFAGGPFHVDTVHDSGVAEQWPDNKLLWWTDKGALSNTVDNATARAWISSAMDKWTTAAKLHDKNGNPVQVTSATHAWQGNVSVDIDETNVDDYYNATEGKTVIVFDKDGMITKDIAGEEASGIPGLTELLLSDSTGTKILKGIVILNGQLLDNGTVTQAEFQAAIQHELGHLFNLDHTQVNVESTQACTLHESCPDSQFIATMWPGLLTDRQRDPKYDDIITISWLYPSSGFGSTFCSVQGEIQDMNGRPLQGVNVVARRVSSDETFAKMDSRAMVSGVLYPTCTDDGHYYLYGLVPGKTYDVYYEPLLSSKYQGMSGWEPLPNPPSGFDQGMIGQAKCNNGGEVVAMEPVKIEGVDFDAICPPTGEAGGAATEGETEGKAGGCALIVPK
jgi:hypothetical protein